MPYSFLFFFFNDTTTPEIYTLSLHDALPISELVEDDEAPGVAEILAHGIVGQRGGEQHRPIGELAPQVAPDVVGQHRVGDRKSTRLNSSHGYISYAVFCLKKKKTTKIYYQHH